MSTTPRKEVPELLSSLRKRKAPISQEMLDSYAELASNLSIKESRSSAESKFIRDTLICIPAIRKTLHTEPASPLRCLSNASPIKAPSLLRNPFVHRSKPIKRTLFDRVLEISEDANMEAPKIMSDRSCYKNDWILRTRMRISFGGYVRNWSEATSTTHRRPGKDADSPSKLNDKTISLEALRNVCTVYQHPYLPWQPLYPRVAMQFDRRESTFTLTKHSQASKMLHKCWCDSLDDLFNLLKDGRCPYFYMCSDIYNILFKSVPSSNPKRPLVQAYISPFSTGMGCELNKIGVEFKCIEVCSVRDNSESTQTSFGSSQTSTVPVPVSNENSSQSIKRETSYNRISFDSGNISDLEDDDGENDNENNDASTILESIGLSQHDFPTLQGKPKGFIDTSSNTQTVSTSNKPLVLIEGRDNLLRFIKFLQTNSTYTISNIGKFACIPPTLLSPCEFRLSTPQYPEVVLSKNMIEVTPLKKLKPRTDGTPKKEPLEAFSSNSSTGPTFVELKGTILPNLYHEVHKLLATSENTDHTCTANELDTSAPFATIPFSMS